MKVAKTVKLKITSHSNVFEDTLAIYRDALGYIIDVVNKEWLVISSLETSKDRNNYVESLIHGTKQNPSPKHGEFDQLFFKFPSYFRRAATAESIGIVSSYRSNLANWELKKAEFQAEGKVLKDKTPTLSYEHYSFPVFYKGNMFKRLSDNQAMIKIYLKNDWKWITIDFKGKNLMKRSLDSYKECNPALYKNGKKYYLHIPFEKSVDLKNTKLKERTIVSVDLGITNTAVCSAMKADGTVIGRVFINQPIEKDRMLTHLGRLKKAQKQACRNSKNTLPNFWRRINNLQKQIIQDTTNQIVAFAIKYNAYAIVFEHLGKFKMPKGISGAVQKLRLKLQFWAKSKIQNKVKAKARTIGIRFSRVSPKNTSKLAFDGSGAVRRSITKHGRKVSNDICVFSTGKEYNADLNASYNIGARYYIREYNKTTSEKKWLQVQAKVPGLAKRTSCTLASLISLTKAI